jgi:hypothetical protein
MKTIAKTLIAISVLMISLSAFAGGTIPSGASVHYKVQIHLPKPPVHSQDVFVVMTDGKGIIAPPQLFSPRKLSYDFYESKNVYGTRIAMLVYFNGSTPVLFNSNPDSKTGKFAIGNTYEFNLFIEIPKPGARVD